ncbi:acylphosphatase [Marinobacter koreensis]|uniref:acylphosphatase n=1 Tax=Marinobacter koreensis TaxID=335974 RepID=UPI003614FF12
MTQANTAEPFLNRWRISVRGVVQGVGFRPFVYRQATELGLSGWVGNSPEGWKSRRKALPCYLSG